VEFRATAEAYGELVAAMARTTAKLGPDGYPSCPAEVVR